MTALMGTRASRHDLRRAFHGPILTAISEQASTPSAGRKRQFWAKQAWKILLARQFLRPQFDAAGQLVDPPSTEAVSDDDFRLFLHEVTAFAVTELNVVFPEKEVR